VRLQVGLPGVLDGGLEGHHQHALGAELLGELVGGEGLAEAHLGVPEEARDGVHVLLPDRVEVGVGLFHGLGLLGRIGEGLVVRAAEALAGAQLGEHGLHVGDRAAHPLQLGVLEALPGQRGAHLVVAEDVPSSRSAARPARWCSS
jgi:hypothetical protein